MKFEVVDDNTVSLNGVKYFREATLLEHLQREWRENNDAADGWEEPFAGDGSEPSGEHEYQFLWTSKNEWNPRFNPQDTLSELLIYRRRLKFNHATMLPSIVHVDCGKLFIAVCHTPLKEWFGFDEDCYQCCYHYQEIDSHIRNLTDEEIIGLCRRTITVREILEG